MVLLLMVFTRMPVSIRDRRGRPGSGVTDQADTPVPDPSRGVREVIRCR